MLIEYLDIQQSKHLSIMQRLYENYKLLTYPRTDSRYITRDIVATLPDSLKAISIR